MAWDRKQRVRYLYDALGRRVQRYIVGGKENTKFIYDGEDVLVDDNNGTLTKYLNGEGIDNKLRSQTGNDVKYFLADHLGSTNGLTDASGNLTEQTSYDSFGNATTNLSTRYQFTGREYDNFTGLHYYRARFYDANLGRFISEDPIGFAGGDINLYGYVRNNSLNNIDPRGLEPSAFDHLFGDGGIFTKQTLSEFISAVERSKRQCKTTWLQRFMNNVYTTNVALPGLASPSMLPGLGIGLLTSGATAKATQSMTIIQWALTGFRGAASGAATYTALETGVMVGATTALNFLYVTVAYETGVVIGSAINATFGFSDYCPCKN